MTERPAAEPDDVGRRASGYRVPLAHPRPVPVEAATPSIRPGSTGWGVAGVVLILVALGIYVTGEWVWGSSTGLGLFAAPILVGLTFFLLRSRISEEGTFDLGGLLLTSIGLRLVLTYPRFLSATDANIYNREGARLATSFRQLDFTNVDVGAPFPGSGALRYIAGLVHVATYSNFFAGTLVFAFMSFWGCWFFYRAFVTAVPDGDRRRYARLLFLWPTLLYWPSSMGKDSWMVLTAGIVALGAARLLTRGRGGYLLLGAGLGLGALVRPHVSLLLFVAVVIAFIVGRRDERRIPGQVSLAGVTKSVGIVVLLVAGSLLAPATARFLKIGDISTDTLSTTIENTQAKTSEGNSAFNAVDPNSPTGYPLAVVTVLFRPLPGEVATPAGTLTGLEGLALLVIVATSWRRLWAAFRRLRSQPFVALAVAYVAMFTYTFAALSNFGILSRERVQVLPLLFVILALPPWTPLVERAKGRLQPAAAMGGRLAVDDGRGPGSRAP
jgi:hypothetical protein